MSSDSILSLQGPLQQVAQGCVLNISIDESSTAFVSNLFGQKYLKVSAVPFIRLKYTYFKRWSKYTYIFQLKTVFVMQSTDMFRRLCWYLQTSFQGNSEYSFRNVSWKCYQYSTWWYLLLSDAHTETSLMSVKYFYQLFICSFHILLVFLNFILFLFILFCFILITGQARKETLTLW